MNRWRYQSIGSLGKIFTGSTPKTSQKYLDGGDIPFVTPAELDKIAPVTMAVRTLSESQGRKSRLLPEGSVMVCCIGSLGKVGIAGRTIVTNQQINSVVFDTELILPRFGFYACRQLKAKLITMALATTVMIVSKSRFEQLEIPVPPLTEQRRMIEIFDSVAGIRSKRREAIAQLDILIQSIFWEMFGEPLRNPQGWDSYTLQEITIKITDGEHLNPHFSPEGIPIIMAGNVREDYIDLENAKKVDVLLGERFRKKCHPVPGDILLVSRGATIGRLCTVDFSDQFCLMGSVILIKLDHLMVESKYLESLLKHPSMYRKLVKTSASSAQQAIYLQDLKQLICMIPPLNIQQEFVYRVGAIAKLKNSHRASLEKLDALFASLQYQGFRGEL